MTGARPSLPVWLSFGVAGGFLGVFNPAWFLLSPGNAGRIVANYDFVYPGYAAGVAGFFIMMLFVPALLSTLLLFPWFYRRMADKVARGRAGGMFSHAVSGFGFGCAASLPAAFFFLVSCLGYNIFTGRFGWGDVWLLPLGIPFIAIIGIVLFLPGLCASGTLFAWATDRIVRMRNGRISQTPTPAATGGATS